jgi:hypothetical protein
MRELLKYLTFIFLVFLINNAAANPIMGGVISYKKAGGDSLEITLTVYRDCNGGNISNTPITITSNTSTRNFTLPIISITDITGINPNCNIKSKCSQGGTFAYGIEEHIFRDIIPVEVGTDCKYIISWSNCCRSTNITTGAAGRDFYIQTTYDKCISPKNSSPTFSCTQKNLLAVGQDASISLKAFDSIDNDEITYEITDPLSAKGVNINYTGQWSAQRPLSFLGFPNRGLSSPAGFHFDTLSGNLSFRPVVAGQSTVMAIKVKEWRKINGVRTLISETQRDLQLTVINSPNNKAPKVGGFSNQTTTKTCKSGTFCIDIPVTDADNNDSLTIDVKHSFSSLTTTKTINSSNNITLKVCYTIDSIAFKGNYTRYFKIIAKDNSCPLFGQAERTFMHVRDSIAVVRLPTNINTFCENDFPSPLISTPSYGTWSGTGVNKNTFFPTIAKKGIHNLIYEFEDSITGCTAKKDLWVKIYEQPKAIFTTNKTTGLPLDSFEFTNNSTADTTFRNFWDMGQDSATGNTQNTFNANHVYNDTGVFKVSLRVDNGVCLPDTAFETITISLPVSVKELSNKTIKLYPNPANKIITIEAETEITTITIYDIQGRVVFTRKNIFNTSVPITVISFNDGMYILKTQHKNGQISRGKFRVAH